MSLRLRNLSLQEIETSAMSGVDKAIETRLGAARRAEAHRAFGISGKPKVAPKQPAPKRVIR